MNAQELVRLAFGKGDPDRLSTRPVALAEWDRLGYAPIRLLDGNSGVVVRSGASEKRVGVHVPDEPDVRLLPLAAVRFTLRGTLVEVETRYCFICRQLTALEDFSGLISPRDGDMPDYAACPDCQAKLNSGRYVLCRTVEGAAVLVQMA